MGVELPKNFLEFEDVRKEGFLRMKKLKEEGRSVVGTFCQYTPSELIDAAGLCEVGRGDKGIYSGEGYGLYRKIWRAHEKSPGCE